MYLKKLFRALLVVGLFWQLLFFSSSWAMPVFDGINWAESVLQTTEAVSQTKSLIDSYKTQLDQYKTLLKNSKSLDFYTWGEASNTINNLLTSIDTLKYYKEQAGSMDAYLSRYQNIDHYKNHPCFNGGSCTATQRQALQQQATNASEAQKRANDAVLRGIDKQQTTLHSDAEELKSLQKQAEGAKGQMAAIQAANQLANAETNQLLQIRGLLIADQARAATRASVIADREAIQAAGDMGFRSGSFKKSSGRTWGDF